MVVVVVVAEWMAGVVCRDVINEAKICYYCYSKQVELL